MDGNSIMNTFKHKGIELDLSDEVISNKFRQAIRNKSDYEIQEYELVNDYLPTDCDVIELGGGIGFISCIISNIITQNSTHIVIEPTLELINIIERNMILNNCMFKIINAAYAPNSESVTLYRRKEAYENTTLQFDDNDDIILHKRDVRTIQLQTLVDTFNTEDFTLVCDIEGQEKNLVTYEMDILEKYCDIIIMEIHNPVKNETLNILNDSIFSLEEKQDNVYVYL